MPTTDGLSLLRRIRFEGCETPAVILTMSDTEDDLAAALRAGVRGYLLKDMEPETTTSPSNTRGSWPAFTPLQVRIFTSAIAECQRQGGRVLSIPSRGAETRVLDILEAHPRAGTPVLHWFSGNSEELQRAIRLGCWFSVGPAMLVGAKGRAHLSEMPLNRVLPETDGPFAKRRGATLMPWEASDITDYLEPLLNGSTAAYSR